MVETPLELEGLWDEVRMRDDDLRGAYVRVTVLSANPERADTPARWVDPAMSSALDRIEERHKDAELTSGESTQRLIREARNGGMYGLEPTE